MAETPRDDLLRSGKLDGLISVEVMCQRSKALPSGAFQPLHRHELTAFSASRAATRSACSSV